MRRKAGMVMFNQCMHSEAEQRRVLEMDCMGGVYDAGGVQSWLTLGDVNRNTRNASLERCCNTIQRYKDWQTGTAHY